MFVVEHRQRIHLVANFGPAFAMETLAHNYVVICGDGCDGAVRKVKTR